MKRMVVVRFLVAFGVLVALGGSSLIFASPALADVTTATVHGNVVAPGGPNNTLLDVPDITVCLVETDTVVATTTSDANGDYEFDNVAPSPKCYVVALDLRGGPTVYATPAWYDNLGYAKPRQYNVLSFPLVATQDYEADVGLSPGVTLEGTVSDSLTEQGIPGAEVMAVPEDLPNWGYTCSATANSVGYYVIKGLWFLDTYDVLAYDPSNAHLSGVYSGSDQPSQTPLPIVLGPSVNGPGSVIPNINVPLQLENSISGTLTDHDTKSPVAGVYVRLFREPASGWTTAEPTVADETTATDGSGHFKVYVPDGTYRLEFSGAGAGGQSYQTHFYNVFDVIGPDVATTWGSSDSVVATEGQQVKSINDVMWYAGSISGAVTDPSHQPVADLPVYALDQYGGQKVGLEAVTDQAGHYRITDLKGGYFYRVQFGEEPAGDEPYVLPDYYASSRATGTLDPTQASLVYLDVFYPFQSGVNVQLIDYTLPLAVIDVTPSTWTSQTVTVNIWDANFFDTNFDHFEYALNGGPSLRYTAPFKIDTEGTTTIVAFGLSQAEVPGETREAYALIDRTPPEVSFASSYDDDTEAMQVSANANDSLSGVDTQQIRVDGGDWGYGSTVWISDPGTHTVDAEVRDKAGNIADKTEEVTVPTPQHAHLSKGPGQVITCGGVTFKFPSVTQDGTVTVTQLDPEHDPPGGFEVLPGMYFDIHTTATAIGPFQVTFQIPADYAGDVTHLVVLHWVNGQWVAIAPSVDPVHRTVTFNTPSFSPFELDRPSVLPVSLSPPTPSPSKPRMGKTVTFKSTISPGTASAVGAVRLLLSHWEKKSNRVKIRGRWKTVTTWYWHLRKTLVMRATGSGSLACSYKIAYKGKWKAIATFARANGWAADVSAPRTFNAS